MKNQELRYFVLDTGPAALQTQLEEERCLCLAAGPVEVVRDFHTDLEILFVKTNVGAQVG